MASRPARTGGNTITIRIRAAARMNARLIGNDSTHRLTGTRGMT